VVVVVVVVVEVEILSLLLLWLVFPVVLGLVVPGVVVVVVCIREFRYELVSVSNR